MPEIDTLVASRTLHTPHPGEAYPGVFSLRPGPAWDVTILCAAPGQSFTALGGEYCYAYETPSGTRAAGFVLHAGDRATLVRADLPASMAEWRIERAGLG